MPKGGADNSMLRHARKYEEMLRNAFLSSISSTAVNKRSDDWTTHHSDDQGNTIEGIGTGVLVWPQKPGGSHAQIKYGMDNTEGR